MHHNKCKVRSGSPVPDRVKAQCPPPQDPPGGCPPAALKRCCQYEQEAPPALICLPLLPAFYETDKQRPGRKEDKACPCCLQPLPPPKPDVCGAPCPPAPPMPSTGHDCHHKAQNQAPMAGKGHDCCGKSAQHQAPMIGMGHDCCGKSQHQAPTSGKGHDCCTKNKQHQLMGGSASSNAHSCHHHDGGAKHDECGQKIPVPAAICCPMPEHHMVCPPFGTDLPCAHEIEMRCTDSCAPPPPPCWQPMSAAHGKQSERCPTPCLAPRLPPCPPACTPGAECLPDQRGALRPDQRDCPALGRNFCVHEAAAPRCPGAPPHVVRMRPQDGGHAGERRRLPDGAAGHPRQRALLRALRLQRHVLRPRRHRLPHVLRRVVRAAEERPWPRAPAAGAAARGSGRGGGRGGGGGGVPGAGAVLRGGGARAHLRARRRRLLRPRLPAAAAARPRRAPARGRLLAQHAQPRLLDLSLRPRPSRSRGTRHSNTLRRLILQRTVNSEKWMLLFCAIENKGSVEFGRRIQTTRRTLQRIQHRHIVCCRAFFVGGIWKQKSVNFSNDGERYVHNATTCHVL